MHLCIKTNDEDDLHRLSRANTRVVLCVMGIFMKSVSHLPTHHLVMANIETLQRKYFED